VDDYLSEQEQVEKIRQWLKENWLLIAGGIVIGVGYVGGTNYMKSARIQKAEAAAVEFEALKADLAGGGLEGARQRLATLEADYSGTPYLDQARLSVAASVLNDGDAEEAEKLLRSVLDSTSDPELARVVRLRLARVLMALERPDDALAVLDLTEAGVFAGQYHVLRGDIFAARDDATAAREEYESALASVSESVDAQTVRRKLAALPAETSES
jgi:predicted negative regulator of RcsB-dependent stress response